MTGSDDLEDEWVFYARELDPIAEEILSLTDPWQAYHRAIDLQSPLVDTSPGGGWDLPHTGEVYTAWAHQTDVYATGKTPIDEAHALLRRAARAWLRRPPRPEPAFIDRWVAEAEASAAALFLRDGDWWHEPR